MKKTNKILLIIIITFLAICQIQSTVYSYTLDEVKKNTNYTIIEDGKTPEEYDIVFDAEDFTKSGEEIPYIKNKIEDILYGDLESIDLNFLNVNSQNKNTSWNKVSKLVRGLFKVFWYISLGLMLTLLIYIAIVLVATSISPKASILPLSKVFKGNDKAKPGQLKKEKKFIEQFIMTSITLAITPLMIIIMIFFANSLTTVFNTDDMCKPIIVYVNNSSIEGSDTGLVNYTFETHIEGLLNFQAQYDWDGHTGENFINLIMAFLITIFKILIYVLFWLTMVLMIFLTAFAPLIVVIDGFMKINGGKGILKIWLSIMAYIIFLKPIIALIYYIFARSNIYLVSEYPYFILVPMIIIVVVVVSTIKRLIKITKQTKNKSKVNKKK